MRTSVGGARTGIFCDARKRLAAWPGSVFMVVAFVTAGAVGPGLPRARAGTGPLVVPSGGHWMEFRGRPALLIGDSVTQGWMELGPDFDQSAYVDALALRGINVLMLWSYIGITDQVADSRIGYDAPELWPWVRTGTTFDLTRFNPPYFERLRALVQACDARDIAVIITIHDGWTKTRFAGHPFNQANGGPLTDRAQYVELHDYAGEIPGPFNPLWSRQQKHQYYLERFCDALVQATGDQPNVIYEIFNEGEWYDQTRLRLFQVHFLNCIKARTPRVTMVNDDHVGGSSFRSEPKCDVISLHRPQWNAGTAARTSFEVYSAEFLGVPVKPFFFSEPVPEYQGDAAWHDGLMRLMWGTAVAGAGFVVQNDTSWGFDPNAAMAAQAANRDAVLDLEGHCARFFNASGVNLSEMRPYGSLASGGACLANPGSEYVVYSQDEAAVAIDLSGTTARFRARFYSPRIGQFGPEFVILGGAARSIPKPTSDDWVLHLVFASDGYPGDFDRDGDVDVNDFAYFQYCFNGPGRPPWSPDCAVADTDSDGDVDVTDFAQFQTCFNGPGQRPACAD